MISSTNIVGGKKRRTNELRHLHDISRQEISFSLTFIEMLNGSTRFTIIVVKTMKIMLKLLFVILFIFTCVKSTSYWPDLSLQAQVNRSCSFDDISACQTSNRTFLFIVWGGAGFCSELNQILLAFAYSVSTKRRFLIDSRSWNYGQFADYFHLPSSTNSSRLNFTFLVRNNHQNQLIDHLKTTRVGTQIRQFWYATQHVQTIAIKRRVAHYLWRSLTEETLNFIAAHRIGNLSNYIGIHVRKGDKLQGEARTIPLKRYITTIERLLTVNQTNVEIFVASDDYTVVDQFRQLKPTWNFLSLHDQNNERTKFTGHIQGHFNRRTRTEIRLQTRLFICELDMLVNARYVLCSMSSNVCRLIQILRSQHPSTVTSMDRSWYGT